MRFFFHSFIGCTSCDIQYKFIIQHNKTRKEKKKRSKNPKGVGATGLTSLRGTAPKGYACSKWCITLSYSKTSVFVLPRVNEWPAFFFTLIVFSEYMWAVGQTGEKIAVFKQNRICVGLATIQVARQLFGNFWDFQQLFRILATFRIFGNFGLFEVLWSHFLHVLSHIGQFSIDIYSIYSKIQ